jgi:glycosyltransferase involved in cell wall biosynthesis
MTNEYLESLVITAFSRKEYYVEAVRSILLQVKGRSDVEVILIKNFVEEEIDRQLELQGVRVYFDSSPVAGSTLRRAFELANGRYVAFLDDDDLFKPSKLTRFEHVLQRYPELGYYHNWYEFSVEDKTGLGAWERLTRTHRNRSRAGSDLVAFGSSDDPGILNFLADRNQEQNLSSTIIHRDVARKILPWLDLLPAMTDTIMLAAGLISRKTLVFDQSVETIVRRHRANVSNRLKQLEKRLDVLRALADLCDEAEAPEGVRTYFTLRSARETVYLGLVRGKSPQTANRDAIRALVQYYRKLKAPRDLAFLLLAGLESTMPGVLPLLRPLVTGS